MPRLLFEKKGNAVWISHLDLMRLFQRAFKRAGLLLKHTQGYNPRPSVSIALPLSVGVESSCELLEFDLDGQDGVSCGEIMERLNTTLVSGIKILDVYNTGMKYRELAFLDCEITLIYDQGIPDQAESQIAALFQKPTLILPKKTKNGMEEQDVIPMIHRMVVEMYSENTLKLNCRICCQNPTLNPAQIVLAINTFLPELTPSHSKCKRVEVYDHNNSVFR